MIRFKHHFEYDFVIIDNEKIKNGYFREISEVSDNVGFYKRDTLYSFYLKNYRIINIKKLELII